MVLRTRAPRRRDRGAPRDVTRSSPSWVPPDPASRRSSAPGSSRALAEGALPGQRVLARRRHRTRRGTDRGPGPAARRTRDDADEGAGCSWSSTRLEELFTRLRRPARARGLRADARTRSSATAAPSSSPCAPTRSGSASEVPTLAGLVSGNDVLVGPIRERELRDVVVRPAQRAGPAARRRLGRGDPRSTRKAPPASSRSCRRRCSRPGCAAPATSSRSARYHASGGVHGAVARLAETDVRAAHGSATGRRTPHPVPARGGVATTAPSTSAAASASTMSRVATTTTRGSRTSRWCSTACSPQPTTRSKSRTKRCSASGRACATWLADDVEGRPLHQRSRRFSAASWADSARDRVRAPARQSTQCNASSGSQPTKPISTTTSASSSTPAAPSRARRSRKRTRAPIAKPEPASGSAVCSTGVALLLVVALVAGVVAVWQRNRADDSAAAAQGAEHAAEAERDQAARRPARRRERA